MTTADNVIVSRSFYLLGELDAVFVVVEVPVQAALPHVLHDDDDLGAVVALVVQDALDLHYVVVAQAAHDVQLALHLLGHEAVVAAAAVLQHFHCNLLRQYVY